jgi:hypothetical protein
MLAWPVRGFPGSARFDEGSTSSSTARSNSLEASSSPRQPRTPAEGGGQSVATSGRFSEDLLMSSSVGKRQRERQKLERAQAKAKRRAARQATGSEPTDGFSPRSESELIEDLGALHRAFEAGEMSPEDFEDRRDRIQAQYEQLPR